MHVYLLAKPLLRTEYFVDVNFSTVLKIPEKIFACSGPDTDPS